MATATTSPPATPPNTQDLELDGDVIRRGIKRTLPCKLTEREFMQIAKTRVDKEALLLQLEADMAREVKKRKDDIAELEDEIARMGRELHTGEQDRTVDCLDVFRRADDGTGWIHTLRINKADDGTKTTEEVERRPATPSETQRHLPGVDGEPVTAGKVTIAHGGETVDLLPSVDDEEGDGGDSDEPEDDGLTELTPAQVAAKESAAARQARRAAGAKSGRGGKGGGK